MKRYLLLMAFLPMLVQAAEIELAPLPAQPLIEVSASQQILNFDVLLTNNTDEQLEVSKYELTVLGPDGAMAAQRRLDTNGMGILTLANRVVKPGEQIALFNPLHSWARDLPLGTMRLDIYLDAGEVEEKYHATLDLHPRRYHDHAKLILPVTGRVFVHDGHDYLSHHRRLDVTGGMARALGVTANMTRYAYDLVIVDKAGRMYRGDGEKNEDWYGFGTPVVAPADGVVVAVSDGLPDNTKSHKAPQLTREAIMANHNLLFGNYVILDHGHGEFSLFAHFKNGSVAVKRGDRVRQGQPIGQMGFSGDAFLAHLHYQLQRDANWGEGLPTYFTDVERFDGSRFLPVADGQIDSGDIVRSTRTP